MLDQAQRMQAIVADLLTLSTLESSPTTDPQPVNMPALIETALSQARALSGGRHEIAGEIDGGLDILGTGTEISSAISNLLINAVRYTPEGGHITVRWRREPDGDARYSVKDTGIGIASHHLPRLTERFYRVDRSRSRESGALGWDWRSPSTSPCGTTPSWKSPASWDRAARSPCASPSRASR